MTPNSMQFGIPSSQLCQYQKRLGQNSYVLLNLGTWKPGFSWMCEQEV